MDETLITDPGAQAQAVSLARARRTLSVWHAIHIPIGMALFVAAFIHIGAALYYATLLR
jgi:predicted cation transporter